MAKKSVVARNVKRAESIERYAEKRNKLLAEMQAAMDAGDFEKHQVLQRRFERIPRDASPIRFRQRCQLTGRSRGVYRKFGLGRSKLRENAMKGNIPGLVKASW